MKLVSNRSRLLMPNALEVLVAICQCGGLATSNRARLTLLIHREIRACDTQPPTREARALSGQ